jgi:UDP-N-acetyl-D-mannosaminuronic acid dehydrogenase
LLRSAKIKTQKVVVVGGCGHVGLPLAIALADKGFYVEALDIDELKNKEVNEGRMPFLEEGAGEKLQNVLKSGHFNATSSRDCIESAEFIIAIIGTPVDEHLNPDPESIIRVLFELKPHFRTNQLLILRSTVFPGVTKRVEEWVANNVPGMTVTFCPERIAEGKAMEELYSLPQIIGARDELAAKWASQLFSKLTDSVIVTTPEEAELAKLFTNAWRYIKFAAVNQFFMMANDYGIDFEKVRNAVSQDYPRAADMPSAGFAAGPCLFKDTMQLAAFSNNTFALGHSSMLVNEGLPLYVVQQIEKKYDLKNLTVGILGMSFKPEVDDKRSSLSYKLRRILQFKAKDVICSDPFVVDPKLVNLEMVLSKSDLIIIGTPHSQYKKIEFKQPVIDVWNLTGNGVLI